MNLLACLNSSEWTVAEYAQFVALARQQGHAVATWVDPNALPPESTTAFDLVVHFGVFRSRHNPGGIPVRVGRPGDLDSDDQVITLQTLYLRLNIFLSSVPKTDVVPHVHVRLPPAADDQSAAHAQQNPTIVYAWESREDRPPRFMAPRRRGPLCGLPPCRYVGPLRDTAGYGEAARHQLWALFRAGLDVRAVAVNETVPLTSWARGEVTLEDATEALINRGFEAGQEKPGLHIYHLPPNLAMLHRAGEGKHICAVVWETSEMPAEWREPLNSFDQTWVPTAWQKDVFERGGVRNVAVVPFHLDPKWFPQFGPSILPGPPRREAETVFYSIFQWSERKAPERLLAAYLTAFTSRDPVRLVLKTYPYSGRPDDFAVIADRVQRVVDSVRYPEGLQPPRIDLVVNHLSRDELLALHRGCDVFVSLHRGEGWGLPIHEALLMGNPVIFTDISAPRELWQRPAFTADAAVHRVPFMLTPVRDLDHGLFRCDQVWGEPNVLVAQQMMQDLHRRLRPDPDLCRRVGRSFNLQDFARVVKEAFAQLAEVA